MESCIIHIQLAMPTISVWCCETQCEYSQSIMDDQMNISSKMKWLRGFWYREIRTPWLYACRFNEPIFGQSSWYIVIGNLSFQVKSWNRIHRFFYSNERNVMSELKSPQARKKKKVWKANHWYLFRHLTCIISHFSKKI